MYKDIHRQLIKKMLIGWILLSLIVGGIVGFSELERIDHYVLALAKTESAKLPDAYHAYFRHPTPENKAKLVALARNSIQAHNFVSSEVYDNRKERIIEESLEQIEPLTNEIEEQRQHEYLMTDKAEYVRIFYNGRLYLKIVTPIFNSQGEPQIIGYFEGIYQVPPEKMHEIGLWLAWSVVQVILAILLTSVILYPVIIGLNNDLIKQSMDLSDANLGMLKVLGGAIAKRDSDTNAHNFRVTIYAIRLAEEVGLSTLEIQALVKGAFLHDVGKIGISDTILLKSSKLTDEEFETMKLHVHHGVDIIKNYSWLYDAVGVVRYHHEKFDGSGYLEGLKGEETPQNARIFAIADVFDALTSKRPYKEPFSYEKSVAILEAGAGTHFDPELLKAFFRIAPAMYDQLSSNEQELFLDELLDQLIVNYFEN